MEYLCDLSGVLVRSTYNVICSSDRKTKGEKNLMPMLVLNGTIDRLVVSGGGHWCACVLRL